MNVLTQKIAWPCLASSYSIVRNPCHADKRRYRRSQSFREEISANDISLLRLRRNLWQFFVCQLVIPGESRSIGTEVSQLASEVYLTLYRHTRHTGWAARWRLSICEEITKRTTENYINCNQKLTGLPQDVVINVVTNNNNNNDNNNNGNLIYFLIFNLTEITWSRLLLT